MTVAALIRGMGYACIAVMRKTKNDKEYDDGELTVKGRVSIAKF